MWALVLAVREVLVTLFPSLGPVLLLGVPEAHPTPMHCDSA